MGKKKKWIKPVLTVLRRDYQENVLTVCKIDVHDAPGTQGAENMHGSCGSYVPDYCYQCDTASNS